MLRTVDSKAPIHIAISGQPSSVRRLVRLTTENSPILLRVELVVFNESKRYSGEGQV